SSETNATTIANNTTAIALNTAKVGYTEALVSANTDVVANTAKDGITTQQSDAIVANTAKEGITAAQASAITENTVKVGYTEALVSANTDVVANTAKISMVLGTTATTALAGDTTVDINAGGTNITTYTQGDILYATSATALTKLPKGTAGQVLTMNTGATAPEWVAATTATYAIGDTHQGGIIFYLDASGKHGLIAAPSDQSTSAAWWNGSYVDTYAYGNGIGAGEGNSQGIRRWQGICSSCYANELCQDLNLGGETDWYLPSKYELNLMYENIGQGNALGLGNIGNFANNYYWSSTEIDNFDAWDQYFSNGSQSSNNKNYAFSRVRAVRAF
ncbi:Lcl C-terminal domain-containing protein, partial [Psychroflexus sp. MES1-P1E]|uniref:Lcl C-terminal domain-containing protein n=1 Tax=Psychroflexus sp. MES1-P1E TaxID=2058320 RepID=UPI000C7B207D